jgi:hypothetical protein
MFPGKNPARKNARADELRRFAESGPRFDPADPAIQKVAGESKAVWEGHPRAAPEPSPRVTGCPPDLGSGQLRVPRRPVLES